MDKPLALFGIPMSSSFVLHTACLEAGLPHTLRWVDRANKILDDGTPYVDLVPKGVVPALVAEDGTSLTETSAVLQYVADKSPEKKLAPAAGTLDRYRVAEWLNFVTSELHAKHLGPIFGRTVPEELKKRSRELVAQPLALVAKHLEGRSPHLVGDSFTVADLYLFWALFALPYGGVPLDAWPALGAYVAAHRDRPTIQQALAIEGPLYLQAQRRAS